MPTNDFKAFAGASGANVLSQAEYAVLAALANGFTAGIAKSAHVNKVLRQATIMAAVIGDFIANNSGANVVDDGTTATILANLNNAVKQIAWGNTAARIATQAEAEAGTDNVKQMTALRVAQAVAALLGGSNHSLAANGYQKLPGGLILQWGSFHTTAAAAQTVTFPITFPNACLTATASNYSTGTAATSWPSTGSYTQTGMTITCVSSATVFAVAGQDLTYLALGW